MRPAPGLVPELAPVRLELVRPELVHPAQPSVRWRVPPRVQAPCHRGGDLFSGVRSQ